MSVVACWPGSTRWIPHFRPTRAPAKRIGWPRNLSQPSGTRAAKAVTCRCGIAAGATGRQRPGAGRRASGATRTGAGATPSALPPAPARCRAGPSASRPEGAPPTAQGPRADRPRPVAGGPGGRGGGAGCTAPAAYLQHRSRSSRSSPGRWASGGATSPLPGSSLTRSSTRCRAPRSAGRRPGAGRAPDRDRPPGQLPCGHRPGGGARPRPHGCLAVLRATYDDATQSLAVTVGVVVLPGPAAARASLHALPGAAAATARGPACGRCRSAARWSPGSATGSASCRGIGTPAPTWCSPRWVTPTAGGVCMSPPTSTRPRKCSAWRAAWPAGWPLTSGPPRRRRPAREDQRASIGPPAGRAPVAAQARGRPRGRSSPRPGSARSRRSRPARTPCATRRCGCWT